MNELHSFPLLRNMFCFVVIGEVFGVTYDAVMQSWQLSFNWGQGVAFQIRDVKPHVFTYVAWVTMKTYVDVETGPFNVTNVYDFHKGQWYLVHHHCFVVLITKGSGTWFTIV
ncbi:hypothetical protein MKX01_036106 [Papaver californicum]|nr:hypothetical protein MKX01_036106 [Papaver californicum]